MWDYHFLSMGSRRVSRRDRSQCRWLYGWVRRAGVRGASGEGAGGVHGWLCWVWECHFRYRDRRVSKWLGGWSLCDPEGLSPISVHARLGWQGRGSDNRRGSGNSGGVIGFCTHYLSGRRRVGLEAEAMDRSRCNPVGKAILAHLDDT